MVRARGDVNKIKRAGVRDAYFFGLGNDRGLDTKAAAGRRAKYLRSTAFRNVHGHVHEGRGVGAHSGTAVRPSLVGRSVEGGGGGEEQGGKGGPAEADTA